MNYQATLLGTVAGEGGPLVIGDAAVMRAWSGIDGTSYDDACAYLDTPGNDEGGLLQSAWGDSILWEMRGGGTADIFDLGSDRYAIIRSWLEDPSTGNLAFAEKLRSSTTLFLGEVKIATGFLAVLWGPENGASIESLKVGRPTGELALDDGAWILRCTPGRYAVYHDSTRTDAGDARRCTLELIPEGSKY